MTINKQLSKYGKNLIADKILNIDSKEVTKERRLKIWNSILNISTLRKMYNYKEIYLSIKDIVPYFNSNDKSRKNSEADKNDEVSLENKIKQDSEKINIDNDISNEEKKTELNLTSKNNSDTISSKSSNDDSEYYSKNKDPMYLLEESSYIKSNSKNSKSLDTESNAKIIQSKNLIQNFDIILLDVKRTFFREDRENKRRKICNLLKCLIFVNPAISYCQGMSYIAAFLIEITNNEEEAFFLLLGIFTNTNYCEIFYKDLYKLKQYFSIFEKSVNLFVPEFQQCLTLNGISASHYASPWLITLFTICMQNIIDYDNPLFLLTIWDNFILHGWHSVINTSVVMIKTYSEDILMLKFEDLLNFLLNDILRASLVQNIHHEKFLREFYSIEVYLETYKSLELISTIEEKILKSK